MQGITDGANAAGARWLDRKIELSDIVLLNTEVEMGELAGALSKTPTGLEGLHFDLPSYAPKHDAVTEHCSAFAATGAATRDGKMVIGHVTWWPQTLAEQTNIMLDIKPEHGHRVLMQSYPGGIESGTDWYQNDAGVVLTETTIEQTPFNAQGTPVAFRARMAAQYGGTIDEVVAQLGMHNNGLYTNEWLIGDAKTNEIAMYELGTNHTKLWRSSKDEWFNGTTGFYWGNNNAKDMSVKLEYVPDPQGAPRYLPFVPTERDDAWQAMYRQYKGQIDEQFAFKAFDSAPLVSRSTMDAKVATSDMANHLMVWGAFGRPNESVWNPSEQDAGSPNHGLFPGGYYLFDAASETVRTGAKKAEDPKKPKLVSWKDRSDELWKGWLLPASDTDTWLVAGSSGYYRTLQSEDVEKAVNALRVRHRGLKLAADSTANRVHLAEIEGELFFDQLRRKLGDEAFLKLMIDYFAENTTKTVTAQSFLDFARTPFTQPEPGQGPAYLPSDMEARLDNAVIVYGTAREGGTNRYVAEELQVRYREGAQREVPVYRDFEATDALLARKDVIFIGRPETNAALAAWSPRIAIDFTGAQFKLDGRIYASGRSALIYAANNPLDAAHMVLIYAGNSPLETARAINSEAAEPAVALQDGK